MKSLKCPKCCGLNIGRREANYGTKTVKERGLSKEDLGFYGSEDVCLTVPFLRIEDFICADCGYIERYVQNIAAQDLEQLNDFQWVNRAPEEKGPYR